MDQNRKAELFDMLLKGIEGKFSNKELYELLRDSCRMSDAEIRASDIQFTDGDWQREAASLGAMVGALANFDVPSVPCKLKDLLRYPLPDSTYLEHEFYDIGFLPVGRLCLEDMTEEEQEKWGDVLAADVCRVFPGAYGTHIEVDNVEPDRLTEFSCAVGSGGLDEHQQKMRC